MVFENNIIYNNIKKLRRLLFENVSDNDIRKYIENHEWIYIYYSGDEANKRGYRTIRPYVLGMSKANNLVIRAWQDRGRSDSFSKGGRGYGHDYWYDYEYGNGESKKGKPGWRMFRVDKIEKIYPIGKKFNDSNGNVMIPPDYKEGSDKDMIQIFAYVSKSNEPIIDPISDNDVENPQKPKINKWDSFNRGNANSVKIGKEDVIKMQDIVSKVYKEKLGNFIVVVNNNNEFIPIRYKDINKVPKSAIVGNLPYLYDTFVKTSGKIDNKFFNDVKNGVLDDINRKTPETTPPQIPFEKKTLFK